MLPSSLPPEMRDIDANWDDDRSSAIELEFGPEDAFDRVTAVPGVPAEVFARRVMENAEAAAARQTPGDPPPARGSTAAGSERDAALELDFAGVPTTPLELADASVAARPPQPSTSNPELDPAKPPKPATASVAQAAFDEMKDRYATGDFTGALVVAESILETDPKDATALRYAQNCREVLTQMYSARLGPLSRRVSMAVLPDEIRWLSLDHRAGFLLSFVDGNLTIEELLDVSGMPRLEALRILYGLVDQRVVALISGS